MRKTLNSALVVVLALVGVTACSADIGERSETLRVVDQQAMISQLLYINLDVSPYPMTAAELEASGQDATQAIPVRVEIFDDLAAVWFAPNGVAQVDRDGLLAVWTVVHRTPISGETENNAEVGVVTPGSTPVFLDDGFITETETNVLPDISVEGLEFDPVADAILDFRDLLTSEEAAGAVGGIGGYHAGCLVEL